MREKPRVVGGAARFVIQYMLSIGTEREGFDADCQVRLFAFLTCGFRLKQQSAEGRSPRSTEVYRTEENCSGAVDFQQDQQFRNKLPGTFVSSSSYAVHAVHAVGTVMRLPIPPPGDGKRLSAGTVNRTPPNAVGLG
jgi:hypothetical protein